MTVIIFLIILAVLILVHELGHFAVSKIAGIKVEEFGLGFPPKLFSKKIGETLYTLNAVPFGGFVKIFGEDSHEEAVPEEDKKRSFYYKPKWIQALVLVAGVSMNIIFAWLLISLGFAIGLPSSADYSGFGKVSNLQLTITEVLPGSPAEKAGLISGDTILSVESNGTKLSGENLTPENLSNLVAHSTGEVDVLYERGKSSAATAKVEPVLNQETHTNMIGVSMDEIGTLKLPIHLALLEGVRTTWLLVKETATGLAKFIWDSVRLKSDLSQVTGPVGIAGIVGQAQALGFVYLLSLVALISINLAIINLIPFPALDGGRLLFVLIEAISSRKIPQSFVRSSNYVGFVILIILMVVVTGHDILKLL